MVKRWGVLVVLLLVAAAGVLFWVSREKDSEVVAEIFAQTSAFPQLISMRREETVDMPKIRAFYEEKLVGVVRQADLLHPGLVAQAEFYLTKAEASSTPTVELQGVEKTIIHSFVTLLRDALARLDRSAGDKANARSEFTLARAYYNGIESTARRRGLMFGNETLFHTRFINLFNYLDRELGSEDQERILAATQEIRALTETIYVLSVIYELEGITENRGGVNDVIAREKQIEGIIFFDIVRDSSKDPEAAAIIERELLVTVDEMNIQLIRESLKLAYPSVYAEYPQMF